MKKVLIGVDGTKGTKAILSVYRDMVRSPEEVIIVHVEKFGGKSLMYDMLGEAEMSTLKEFVKGTEYKEAMDRRAEKVINYYKEKIGDGGKTKIKTVVREGHPAEEILKVAEEEGVDLIVLGCNGKSRLHKLITGCVTKDVERMATVPVLVAKTAGCEKIGACKEVGEAYAAG